ncbi:uncharacterized protein A4U43_C07F33210 [Asparagus officinalis]|uniref:KIB1-4 beta-propeller domain-containing protein n=1 Tax=Asparagus officinalis TaxID=4686 RepID=A0A5P1EGS0_ASPOF|nr:uncharacterized protein A4U43_C07F33210 [Asparagus officinalis]
MSPDLSVSPSPVPWLIPNLHHRRRSPVEILQLIRAAPSARRLPPFSAFAGVLAAPSSSSSSSFLRHRVPWLLSLKRGDEFAYAVSSPPTALSPQGLLDPSPNDRYERQVGPSPPICSYSGYHLAYTRPGIDRAWIDLKDTLPTGDSFRDVVAYKDGLFCALDSGARKVVALDFSSPPTVRSTDLTLNLPAYRDRNDGWACFQEARLVNSSSELFLVRWRGLVKVGEAKRREVDVHKLMDVGGNDADKKWVPVRSLGSSSFFLGLNRSISLSTATFPRLRTNCIYIPRDAVYRENDTYPATLIEDDDDLRTHLIYDMGDEEGWDEYYSSEWFYGLWMTPRLPSKTTC